MKLGFDPEYFLVDKQGNFFSSVGTLEGTKEDPFPIGEGCYVQEDNVTAEFNIPPCENKDDVKKYIKYVNNWFYNHYSPKEISIKIAASAYFDPSQLETPQACHFGCEPDFNAYTKSVNRKPKGPPTLRSAGGHIHIETSLDILEVVKAMDLFFSCPMIKYDKDVDRRKLYGKAGAFREKSYGVEYRTPSNFWCSDDKWIDWMWTQTEKALKFVENGNVIPSPVDTDAIQSCINDSNFEALEYLQSKYTME